MKQQKKEYKYSIKYTKNGMEIIRNKINFKTIVKIQEAFYIETAKFYFKL